LTSGITSLDSPLTIFVEGIRWLGVRWSLRSAENGVRRRGYQGRFVYWRWHSTWRAMLALPVIMDSGLLERESRRLAEHIVGERQRRPEAPIFLIGCSCGCHVALRALEYLPEGAAVESVGLLAAAVSPQRDLGPALSHIRGRLVSAWSPLDFLILGAGTTLFGTGDRRHTPSAGMIGLRHPSAKDPRVIQIRWRPSMIAHGWLGDHFTAGASGLVANYVAPAMGVV
jgi:hypothetical protein